MKKITVFFFATITISYLCALLPLADEREEMRDFNYKRTSNINSNNRKTPFGVLVDLSEADSVLARQAREYEKYKKNKEIKRRNSMYKIASGENNIWQQWMDDPEDQENYGNCWVHAATGVVEGLLHKHYGNNVKINLDECNIGNNIPDCPGHDIGYGTFYCSNDSGGHPDCAFNYIRLSS